jgi:hypothetical protein
MQHAQNLDTIGHNTVKNTISSVNSPTNAFVFPSVNNRIRIGEGFNGLTHFQYFGDKRIRASRIVGTDKLLERIN